MSLNGLNSGLPHAHILVILDPADKPDTPAAVDRLVCAELPDPVAQPALWSIITKHNMHLCRQPAQGVAACCDASGVCTKRFPRDFNADTALGDDEYAQYRRRNNGRTYEKFYRGELHSLDNRHVVPYNPSLSLRYNAHINVEICSSIKAVKYVVKYVNKGPDRAAVNLNRDGQHDVPVDEIKEYLEGRYVGSCEAAWRTFGFGLGAHSHTIVRLPVHLDGDDQVVFDEAADLEDVAETAGGHTKLTAFFKLCATLPLASRDITYQDVPVHYTWHALTREWRKRQRGGSKTSWITSDSTSSRSPNHSPTASSTSRSPASPTRPTSTSSPLTTSSTMSWSRALSSRSHPTKWVAPLCCRHKLSLRAACLGFTHQRPPVCSRTRRERRG